MGSTWEDTSWQSGDTGAIPTVAADDSGSASNDWTDSYQYGGDSAAHDPADRNGHALNGSATSASDASEASGSTNSWTDWQPSDPGTADWSATTSDEPEETYTGWTPAGASLADYAAGTVPGPAASATTDHTAAQQAYAARPAVDPDVAAAAAEPRSRPRHRRPVLRPDPAPRTGNSDRPSAEDLITARSKGERQKVKANSGLRKAFGLGPSVKEMLERDRIDRIARPLNGRKTIMVINTKGGGGKTLVTLMLASLPRPLPLGLGARVGQQRDRGHPRHARAVAEPPPHGRRPARRPADDRQRPQRRHVRASSTGCASSGASPSTCWPRPTTTRRCASSASRSSRTSTRRLSRFYRMIVVDTGNNRLSPNWLAAAARADMLVFATSLKDDTSVVAAKNLDALVAMGRGDLVRNAVCVISHTSAKGNDVGAGVHTREHFEQWVRAVVDIPYDPMLAPGLHLDPLKISRKTHESCMEMAAVVVDGL